MKEWQYDKKSFFYNGTDNESSDELINIARATKENVKEYTLSGKGKKCISVHGNGDISYRIEKRDNKMCLYLSNAIDKPDLSWGNYSRNIKTKGFKGKVNLRIISQ